MQIVRPSGLPSRTFGIKPCNFILGILGAVGIALTFFSLLFGFRICFGVREPEKTLRDLSDSVMREVIGDRTVDEVLTDGCMRDAFAP